MENLQWRATVALVLSLLVLLLWDHFLGVPTPKAPPAPPKKEQQISEPAPEKPVTRIPEIGAAQPGQAPAATHPARDVVVTTDLYRAVFTERGARLKSFKLFKYRETVAKDSPPMELVRTDDPAQWPLGLNLLKPPLNTADAVFTASQTSVDLRARSPQAEAVSFELATPEGVRVVKRFEFRRDRYRIDLRVAVQNLT